MSFLDDRFLLSSKTALNLFENYAAPCPILDYHCHLSPKDIAENRQFNNLTEAWLEGDHYKWRAMRTYGIAPEYITGSRPAYEKFEKWAEVVPYTLRNPLYHWTHLELKRYFGISTLLHPGTAREIYDTASRLLQTHPFSVRGLLKIMGVQVVCTTDDPTDDLSYHRSIASSGFEVKVLPTFRPDKVLATDQPLPFNRWVDQLSKVSNCQINSLSTLMEALEKRMQYFHSLGCRLSDHGLEYAYAYYPERNDWDTLLQTLRKGEPLRINDSEALRSEILYRLCVLYHKFGWVQQLHLGALRNNNTRMLETIGPDTGFDSIGDFAQASHLSKLLNRLDTGNQLTKTILYNLNPADNEVFATMIGNFNDGSVKGKIQFGSGWWFLDQKDGMTRQINALSNMGLLSCFVGMLTDSRSFLSYPRHEYFRRLLCRILGEEIEDEELPNDLHLIGNIVQDICYRNAKAYFNF
jgi:glucuronate isomerase